MSNVAVNESVLFKRVGDGHVFQAPNPWIFGRSTRYLVNDAQKADLLAIITPRRPYLRAVVILAGIVLWAIAATTLVWAFSGNDDPTAYDVAAMAVLILVPMCVALLMALQRNLKRMQPILAGAPLTEKRITRVELRQAMAKVLTLRQALLVGVSWSFTALLQIFMLVIRNGRHPLFGDIQSFLNVFLAVVAAGLAIHYLMVAIRKMRLRQSR